MTTLTGAYEICRTCGQHCRKRSYLQFLKKLVVAIVELGLGLAAAIYALNVLIKGNAGRSEQLMALMWIIPASMIFWSAKGRLSYLIRNHPSMRHRCRSCGQSDLVDASSPFGFDLMNKWGIDLSWDSFWCTPCELPVYDHGQQSSIVRFEVFDAQWCYSHSLLHATLVVGVSITARVPDATKRSILEHVFSKARLHEDEYGRVADKVEIRILPSKNLSDPVCLGSLRWQSSCANSVEFQMQESGA